MMITIKSSKSVFEQARRDDRRSEIRRHSGYVDDPITYICSTQTQFIREFHSPFSATIVERKRRRRAIFSILSPVFIIIRQSGSLAAFRCHDRFSFLCWKVTFEFSCIEGKTTWNDEIEAHHCCLPICICSHGTSEKGASSDCQKKFHKQQHQPNIIHNKQKICIGKVVPYSCEPKEASCLLMLRLLFIQSNEMWNNICVRGNMNLSLVSHFLALSN